MKTVKKIFGYISELLKRTDEDVVYAVAGHSTLFIIISFFPILMLLLTTVKYLPLSEERVLDVIKSIPLGAMNEPIHTAVNEIYTKSSSFVMSITVIGLIWSASTSVYSVVLGLNRVYNHKETRGYIKVRGLAILYTLVFLVSILIALGLMVFGKSLLKLLDMSGMMLNLLRMAASFLILVFLFDFLYTTIPNRPSKMLFEFPGAVFSALGWFLFSYIYSLYIENYSNVSYVYGSLAAVVFLMIWLYFCMYIFFIGAEINQMAAEFGWCKNSRVKYFKRLREKGKKI